MYLNLVIRMKLANKPGNLARVLTIIAQEGGTLGAIDLVSASPSCVIRDLMIRLESRDHLNRLVSAFEQMPEINILRISDRVFVSHQGGKIEISPKRPILSWEDLALMYTPGVAGVS
ncbi:MAG: ACT domain-containing protein [Desulfotomaculaceae bacterium]